MNDSISRKIALDTVRAMCDRCDTGDVRDYRDLMLEAFETLPSAKSNLQPTCNQLATDCISRQAAIDAMMKLQTEDIEAYGASIPEGFDGDRAVTALKALPSALRDHDEIQMEIYVSGYEKGAEESLAAVLNAFKKVRDELPADKRETYTDDFCKLMGRMLDELERKE